jgi:tripartite-type tricarboxylate transporter receptor subunit TctC
MGFTGLKSFDEILKSGKTIKMGGTGPGSHSLDMPLMLNRMTGAKFNVVSGYQGTAQIRLALQRREVEGLCTNWDSVLATQRDLLDAKGDEGMIPFIIHARVPELEAKSAVLVSEVIKDASDLHTYKVYMAPGTPKLRLEILRRAFKTTLADPEFLAQANKLKLDISHVSGEESEKLVNEVLSIPPKVKDNLSYLSSVK